MGTVEGTANDDIIDVSYLGDPDGDVVDGGTGTGPGGGPDDDIIAGFEGNDTVYAGVGNDVVFGGLDDDLIFGGDGNDILKGNEGQDLIFGGDGEDTLFGGEGDDTLKGGAGNDILYGGEGIDFLGGQDDRDILVAGYGDYADGGDGGDDFDVLDLRGLGPYRLENLTPDSNGNGFDGQVVFLDAEGNPTGDIIDFVEIEQFIDGTENRDPIAIDDAVTVTAGGTATIVPLANDSDPDGDVLSITTVTAPEGTGAVVIGEDGLVTFTPAPGVTGEVILSYEIIDGNGGTATANIIVTVEEPENAPPDAVDDALVRVIPGQTVVIPVLDNDSDPDGDPIRIVSATALYGTVVINADGTLSYTPSDGLAGPDEITYTITDDISGTDTAIVPIMVRDGTVEGTRGDDLIDVNYTGDPNGDFVDADDAILPGDSGNDDLILAYGGNDTVIAGDGNDEVYGGAGDNSIAGNDGNDTLYGNAGNDIVRGGTGEDTLFGGAGDDELFGGAGNDTVIGNSGDDTLTGGSGNDLLIGGQGNDSILGGSGADTAFGGQGDDVIDTRDPSANGNFDNPYPGFGPADPFPEDDRDSVLGGQGNDTIFTGDDRDSIGAGQGDDFVDAGIDNDTVAGGAGNDTIIGGEGEDIIFGQTGDDLIYGGLTPEFDFLNIADDDGDLLPENNRDTIWAGLGNDTVYGQDDDDTIYGQGGDDLLYGGVDDDEIWAGIGNDTAYGGQGDDLIRGQAGNDLLFGDDGDDTIYGGVGNDIITGGAGIDTLFGGSDRDIFIGGQGGDSVNGGSGGDDFDILDLRGVDFESITYTSDDREDGFVTFADGSVLTFEEIENVIPCFTPGTTIATPRGERLVEDLQVGDRIITRDNGIQEIRWVGAKEITGKTLLASPHLKPVLIKAGALGNGLPERDMMVSPNHRVLVAGDRTQLYFEESEVLAAAKHLVGTPGVHEVEVMATSYIHFMFDRHEVVLSNGAWTESFQPGDYSLKGIGNAQRNEIIELFPELASKEGLEAYQSARKSLKKHEARLLVR